MRVNFYLKRTDAEETCVYARFFVNKQEVKIYLNETVEPKYWNAETHRGVRSSKFIGHSEFNTRLDNIEQKIKEVYRRLQNDSNGNMVSTKLLKETICEELYPDRNKPRQSTLMGLFATMIDESERGVRLNPKTGKSVSEATIKTYRTTFQHLTDFRLKGNAVEFNSVDMDFYNRFKNYLIEERKLRNNALGKHIQILKTVLNEGLERKLHTNTSHKSRNFAVIHEKSDSIYLSVGELALFSEIDLRAKPTFDHVRDLFLITCYTALRQSDVSRLSSDNFKEDGFIHVRQQKTNDDVAIPINDEVRRIFEKYNGDLPPAISDQKTNKYLKEIGEMIEALHVLVTLNYTKAGKAVSETVKKYKLLCTHTGRRTFATNEYLTGTPVQFIMSVTGHQSEKAFMRYIKLSQKDKARMVKLIWDNRNKLRVA
jgi:hypothetical protein